MNLFNKLFVFINELLIIIPINLNNKVNKDVKFNRLFVLNMHG